MSISGRTALLAKPNLHRAGPGGRKQIKGGAKCSLTCSLSLSHAYALSLSLYPSTSHPPTPTLMHSFTLVSSLRMVPPPQEMGGPILRE